MLLFFIRKWLKTDFMSLVHKHHTTISSKTNKATAISTTNGILTILKAWNNDGSPEDVFSLGVISTGKAIWIILKHENVYVIVNLHGMWLSSVNLQGSLGFQQVWCFLCLWASGTAAGQCARMLLWQMSWGKDLTLVLINLKWQVYKVKHFEMTM